MLADFWGLREQRINWIHLLEYNCMCVCVCVLSLFLLDHFCSLFPLSKESLPVVRELFQSQGWLSPPPSFLFMSYICVILTKAKTGKNSQTQLYKHMLWASVTSICVASHRSSHQSSERSIAKIQRTKILNFKNSYIFKDINRSIVPWTEGVQWYLINE